MTNHADHDLCHIMPQGRRSESHVKRSEQGDEE